MLDIIFSYWWETVLIQRILIGLEWIGEKLLHFLLWLLFSLFFLFYETKKNEKGVLKGTFEFKIASFFCNFICLIRKHGLKVHTSKLVCFDSESNDLMTKKAILKLRGKGALFFLGTSKGKLSKTRMPTSIKPKLWNGRSNEHKHL